jgi:uncharacterized protein YfcZ (UPF0381/DUF406 family)
MSNKTNTDIIDNNSLTIEIASLHKKMHGMEEDMKQLIEKNKKIENELSQMMSFLVSFAEDVKYDLHHIKYK